MNWALGMRLYKQILLCAAGLISVSAYGAELTWSLGSVDLYNSYEVDSSGTNPAKFASPTSKLIYRVENVAVIGVEGEASWLGEGWRLSGRVSADTSKAGQVTDQDWYTESHRVSEGYDRATKRTRSVVKDVRYMDVVASRVIDSETAWQAEDRVRISHQGFKAYGVVYELALMESMDGAEMVNADTYALGYETWQLTLGRHWNREWLLNESTSVSVGLGLGISGMLGLDEHPLKSDELKKLSIWNAGIGPSVSWAFEVSRDIGVGRVVLSAEGHRAEYRGHTEFRFVDGRDGGGDLSEAKIESQGWRLSWETDF